VKKRTSLILGIPDERAPQILTEVESVAALLPRPDLFIGKQATAEVLVRRAWRPDLLHIATHGMYRQDNPMFSGIRLGDGYLNLYDLYQMRLGANLVTLSGCATGMNLVAAGDELLGLQRGLFCAGATSLLLSLWTFTTAAPPCSCRSSTRITYRRGYGAFPPSRHAGRTVRESSSIFLGPLRTCRQNRRKTRRQLVSAAYIFPARRYPYSICGAGAADSRQRTAEERLTGEMMKHFSSEEWIDFVNQGSFRQQEARDGGAPGERLQTLFENVVGLGAKCGAWRKPRGTTNRQVT